MALEIKKLEVLKEKMVTCQDFKEVWNYFFDNLAENENFLNMGKKVNYDSLKTILEKIGQELLNKPKLKPTQFLLIGLLKQNFYHGAYFLDNKLVNFIFFKDIDKGMVAIASSPRSKEILFSRFSLTELKDGFSSFSQISLN